MQLEDLLRVLRRGWWVVALAAVLGALLAGAVAGDGDVRIAGRVVIGPDAALSADDVRAAVASNLDETVLNTFADVATSTRVVTRAHRTVPDAGTVDGIGGRIGTRSRVVDVWVDGSDAAVARRLDAAVLREAIAVFEDLYPVFRVEVIDPPREVTTPGLDLLEAVAVGALLGGAIGFGLVCARERLTNAARSQ
jgi:hypothetical protein